MTIEVFCEGTPVKVDFSTFPGGEEHVRVDTSVQGRPLVVHARITSSSEAMRLLMLSDAIHRMGCPAILKMPYLPYARQDRVCNPGEAFGIFAFAEVFGKSFCDTYSEVWVADVHSGASSGWLVNEMNLRQYNIIASYSKFVRFIQEENCILVAPDKGALYKAGEVAIQQGLDSISANKVRDPLTTKIVGVSVDADIDPTRHYMIIDDICDGGRTFVELAKVLREKGATKVSLYVTHGIFSSGFGVFDGYIDTIWTTNSFYPRYVGKYNDIEINVFDIFSII